MIYILLVDKLKSTSSRLCATGNWLKTCHQRARPQTSGRVGEKERLGFICNTISALDSACVGYANV